MMRSTISPGSSSSMLSWRGVAHAVRLVIGSFSFAMCLQRKSKWAKDEEVSRSITGRSQAEVLKKMFQSRRTQDPTSRIYQAQYQIRERASRQAMRNISGVILIGRLLMGVSHHADPALLMFESGGECISVLKLSCSPCC